VPRFDATERLTHWVTALLVLTVSVTGVILYVPSLSVDVGNRLVIEDLHVYTGIAMFFPIAAALAGPWGRRLRADLASMNRYSHGELAWLRSFGRSGWESVGKFNPGQKLNSAAVAALSSVMLVTGLILRWGNFLAVGWRTGATFVHDWFALAMLVLVAGHIVMALTHPSALRSMVTGTVPASWLSRHAPAWRAGAAATPGRPAAERDGRPASGGPDSRYNAAGSRGGEATSAGGEAVPAGARRPG
jgi:formate dehydrogenase subunit gamma